jgi:hypothetical protein
MSPLLIFGSIFLYRDSTYIYLAGTDEVWYAAKILDKEKSIQLKRLTELQIRRNMENIGKQPLFCFVELRTEAFKGQIAHLGHTENDTWSETPKLIEVQLDREDLKSLKEEIVRPNAPVPSALPQLIKSIDL